MWSNFTVVFDSRIGTIGLLMVLFWVTVSIVSLFWTPYSPNATDFLQNQGPSLEHPMGTDHLGRDMLSRLMVGSQVILIKTRLPKIWTDLSITLPGSAEEITFNLSLLNKWVIPGGVAIWGVIGSLLIGVTLGLLAGYKSGRTDNTIMQLLDALIAFPRIVLYLVVIAALGQGDLVVILAITMTGAPGVARLARGLALDIKTRDYIQAAQTRGERGLYVMFREILPNARGPILVDAMLRVGYAIFAIATLGFLGIGLPPPEPDWGTMVSEARRYIWVNPAAVLWPSLAISTLVVGLNLFADGLNEETSRYQK